jgi:hypothetical protein
VFISAVTGDGLMALKDALWAAITDDANRIEEIPITHRPLDGHHRVREEDDFIFAPTPVADDFEDEAPDAGGRMIDDIEYDDGEDYIEDEDGPTEPENLDDVDYEFEYDLEVGPDGEPRPRK